MSSSLLDKLLCIIQYTKVIKHFFFFRKRTQEKRKTVEKNILSLYKEIENFLISDECTQDLRNELEKSIPDCLTVHRKWVNDLEKSDHSIVIAGKLRNDYVFIAFIFE